MEYPDSISSITEKLRYDLKKHEEHVLEQAFNKWGFTKEYVKKHSDEFKVLHDGETAHYYHNDIHIFDIVTEIIKNEIRFTVTMDYKSMPINEPKAETLTVPSLIHNCGNCKYWESFNGVCFNGDSDEVADYTDREYCCRVWERKTEEDG
jgi:hypothetical protein